MDEFNNQNERMYPNQRFNSNDNPYVRYDRQPNERRGFIDPANPLQLSPDNQRPQFTPPPPMSQRPIYQVPQQPVYPQQQMPFNQPQQQARNPQMQNGYNITQGQASHQDYEDQFDYTRPNRQNPYPYPNQPKEAPKKRGLFSSFLNKNKPQPEYKPTYPQTGVIIQTPQRIDDIKTIIDMLKGGNTLLVDFDKMNDKDCQRMIDYLSGAIYALGGVQKSIGDRKFIFTPEGTGITGQLN